MKYPAPRRPHFRGILDKQLESAVRRVVNRKTEKEFSNQPHIPRYNLSKGQKVLFVALTEYDEAVIRAYVKCFRELGTKVDLFLIESETKEDPHDSAVPEAQSIEPAGEDEVVYTRLTNILKKSVAESLVEREHYDMIVSGTAGPLPLVPFKWAHMEYVSREEFQSKQIDFPFELQRLIDSKVFDEVKRCTKVRITDPEGTDINFTNYDDERPLYMTHIWGKPINLGYRGSEDCNGVIAGTLNHLGAFPLCKVYLKDSLIERVEGGGKYGDVWREKLENYRNTKFPEFPLRTSATLSKESEMHVKIDRPGFFWYWECGIGTVPGVFRLHREGQMKCFANFLHERRRAGYVHHGFGGTNAAIKQLTDAGLPWTHCHIHNMFATYEGTAENGEKIKVIDRGHLTALDDPEVRELAKKFGDPKKLLREDWIPAVPGINVKGNYMKDYASDPCRWIMREEKNHPIFSAR